MKKLLSILIATFFLSNIVTYAQKENNPFTEIALTQAKRKDPISKGDTPISRSIIQTANAYLYNNTVCKGRKKHQSKGDGNKENQTERVVKQRFCGCLPLQPNSKERQDNASFPLPSHYLSCYQLKAKKQHS